jgi:hypothetical protein
MRDGPGERVTRYRTITRPSTKNAFRMHQTHQFRQSRARRRGVDDIPGGDGAHVRQPGYLIAWS